MTLYDVLDFIEETGISLQQVKTCENFEHIKCTILHIEAIKKLEHDLGIEHLQISKYHDLDKLAFYYVLSVEDAHNLHTNIQKHHDPLCTDYKTSVEKVLDWESAHLTKPDKPLSAYETLLKYKPDEIPVIEPVLRDLGLWGEVNCRCISWEEFYKESATISALEVLALLERRIDYVKVIATIV